VLFAVRFHDDPDRSEVRKTCFDAHLDWLHRHRDKVLAAGSLRPEPGSAPVGGLWIVEAADKDAVEVLLQSDPFWVHGLRQSVEIHFWHKAFAQAVTI
jgi:uncharacterized protein YciI